LLLNLSGYANQPTPADIAFASVAQKTHSALGSVQQESWWMPRHNAVNARVAQGNVDLLMIGDSITYNWESQKDLWAKHYAPRNAVKLDFPGDRTQHVLWRLENGNIDTIDPKLAVIMIGTNNSNGSDNTAEEIGDGIIAICSKLRTELPDMKILILAIFPRNATPGP
jgi:beta-glucosidase